MTNEQLVLDSVRLELMRAQAKFPPMASLHEGYAILKEEVDELWDEVKGQQRRERIAAELLQVAAMAVRMYLDCVPKLKGNTDAK